MLQRLLNGEQILPPTSTDATGLVQAPSVAGATAVHFTESQTCEAYTSVTSGPKRVPPYGGNRSSSKRLKRKETGATDDDLPSVPYSTRMASKVGTSYPHNL